MRVRRARAGAAAALMVGLPLGAFVAAPQARADGQPGANLAGLNASAYATSIQVIPLIKGLLPAGDLATGDFAQLSMPYAAASSQTGPASNATSTPVYPGPTATSLPGALQEFGLPASFAQLFADPVLAQAAFPPEPGSGSSGHYAPPAGSTTGLGTADAQAAEGGASSRANLSSTPLLSGLISIGSSTSSSSTTVGSDAVSDVAHADLNHVVIMGLVDIASISSESTSSSNGSKGTEKSTLKVGAVTVAGLPAYIGPDGIHLQKTSNDLGGLVGIANSALTALQQAGLSITTIAPIESVQGAAASVDSGAVQVKFIDNNVPNPQGDVPFTGFGAEFDFGLTHADAQATGLPPIPPISVPVSPPSVPVSLPSSVPTFTGGTGSGGSSTIIETNNSTSGGSGPSTAPLPTGQGQPTGNPAPASFIGMPTRLAWVVIAVILSIVASGPLLGYANWQLLRGRKS